MDLVLGMSMAPSTVNMVLVEGQNGNGATVDQDGFPLDAAAADSTAKLSASDQVMSAILGTREGATQGGYRLASTGVAYADPVSAAALRDALAAHQVQNVMLVSAFLSAAALAHAHGAAAGYTHTGLLFIEPDSAALAVIDSADGSVTDVRQADLPDDDLAAVGELRAMAAGADSLQPHPQGLFVVGSTGVDIEVIRAELDAATPLDVSTPIEPETALARGAALAAAHTPLGDLSTSALAYAQDPDSGVVGPAAGDLASGGPVDNAGAADRQLAYSAEPAGPPLYAPAGDAFTFAAETGLPKAFAVEETETGRRPFLIALGVLIIFIVGVAALTLSLALDIRPSVDTRPGLGKSVVAPPKSMPPPPPAPAAPPHAPAAPPRAPAAPPPAPVAPPPAPLPPPPPLPVPGPGPWGPGPRPPIPGPGPMPGIPHGPGPGIPGLPGIPHGPGPGLPHLPGIPGL